MIHKILNIMMSIIPYLNLYLLHNHLKYQINITLSKGYSIEVEGPQLYKLLQQDQVVAPFASVEELCLFIKMDMQLNEESRTKYYRFGE